MKKTILLCLSLVFGAEAWAQKADTLTFHNDYYRAKREVEEIVPVTKRNVVMLGNSLTERGFWSEYFPEARVLNRGIGGDCISGMINRLPPIVEGQPRAIFVMGGVNDLLFSKISYEKLVSQYERLLDYIAAHSPRTKVYVQSPLPVNEAMNMKLLEGQNTRLAEYAKHLRAMAERRGLVYIDIWGAMQRDGSLPAEYTSDGIHLTGAGYRVWIEQIAPYMK